MGANDAAEMLEVAKAECARLERDLAEALAEVKRLVNLPAVQQPNRDALIKAILVGLRLTEMSALQKDAIIDAILAALAVPATPPEELSTAVFEALGAVSVCWSNYPSLGVFDSTEARRIGDELMAKITPLLGAVPATPTLGDFISIGSECFADAEATVISYKGENYYRGAVPATGEDAKWRKAAEVVLAEVKINGTPALEFIDKVVTP